MPRLRWENKPEMIGSGYLQVSLHRRRAEGGAKQHGGNRFLTRLSEEWRENVYEFMLGYVKRPSWMEE